MTNDGTTRVEEDEGWGKVCVTKKSLGYKVKVGEQKDRLYH